MAAAIADDLRQEPGEVEVDQSAPPRLVPQREVLIGAGMRGGRAAGIEHQHQRPLARRGRGEYRVEIARLRAKGQRAPGLPTQVQRAGRAQRDRAPARRYRAARPCRARRRREQQRIARQQQDAEALEQEGGAHRVVRHAQPDQQHGRKRQPGLRSTPTRPQAHRPRRRQHQQRGQREGQMRRPRAPGRDQQQRHAHPVPAPFDCGPRVVQRGVEPLRVPRVQQRDQAQQRVRHQREQHDARRVRGAGALDTVAAAGTADDANQSDQRAGAAHRAEEQEDEPMRDEQQRAAGDDRRAATQRRRPRVAPCGQQEQQAERHRQQEGQEAPFIGEAEESRHEQPVQPRIGSKQPAQRDAGADTGEIGQRQQQLQRGRHRHPPRQRQRRAIAEQVKA
ncbi:hypothetical protein OJJOAM_002705 [Cupriavidus sp. H18C1]